jgi:DNA-binding NtrC family response regulator
MKQSILVIDDEPNICMIFKRYLSNMDFEVQAVPSVAKVRETLSTRSFDAAIIDQNLPDGKGVDLIEELRGTNPDMAIVVITGVADIPLAVETMRRGADNFLTKPVNLENLEVFLRKSMEVGSLRRKVRSHQLLEKKNTPVFGTSQAAESVMELARMAAANESSVLISGETGVGKGVLAQWIHGNSSRNTGVFVDVNCSCLRGELLASELFGHVRGAFTSAVQDRPGLLDAADRGTLFLDEIGDMDVAIQSQFLKVVEEKSYRRLGETRTRRSDFRLICATNRDLGQGMLSGAFRKDLYFRIKVVPIHVPALRERPEDIPLLASHILTSLNFPYRDLSPEVAAMLRSYSWPGNVRELRNVLEYAVLRAQGHPLLPEHIPLLGRQTAGADTAPPGGLSQVVDESIRAALIRYGGDITLAAQSLGISRATIYRKLKRLRESVQ